MSTPRPHTWTGIDQDTATRIHTLLKQFYNQNKQYTPHIPNPQTLLTDLKTAKASGMNDQQCLQLASHGIWVKPQWDWNRLRNAHSTAKENLELTFMIMQADLTYEDLKTHTLTIDNLDMIRQLKKFG